MVETAAHLADHVLPCLPVRQWVLSVPKRLRYFLQTDQTDPAVQNLAMPIFLSAVEQGLRTACPAAGNTARIGAVAFIHRLPCSIHICISTVWWSIACSRWALRRAPRHARPCAFTKRPR
jgi:hypothetical protein